MYKEVTNMKKNIFILTAAVIAIVSFFYFFKVPIKETTVEDQVESISISKEEYASLLAAKQSNKTLQANTLESMAFIPVSTATDDKQMSSVDVEFESQQNVTNIVEQRDTSELLVAWSKAYQKELFDIVDNNMPAHTADFMKLQLNKNSLLLNNRKLKQNAQEDENWAFLMEDNIRFAIEQHELKPDFDILSIKCKQLSCEIIGIERGVDTWHEIYVSLFSALPNAIFPDINDSPRSYSIREGDVDYSFSNISFEKS
jgi:hypothetical protein